MLLFKLAVVLLPLAISAAPNPVAVPVLAPAISSICAKDAVYLALAAPVIASTASRFCSSYIRSTATATTKQLQSVTATVTSTVTATTIVQKRAVTINLSTFAPASLLSSACSCLLVNSPPPATTIYPFTQTVYTTVATVTKTQSVTETCSSAAFTSPIQNGDFAQGSAGWTIATDASEGCGGTPAAYCFNSGNSGLTYYNNGQASQYFTISQTLTACAGTKYTLTATFKSEFCGPYFQFLVDGQTVIDGSSQACGEGVYPYLDYGPFHTVSATFMAQTNAPVFAITMRPYSGGTDTWRVQSISVAPS